ncbi:DNA polymerase [Agrobacterium rosae]|uniref:DNA polymerase n=1 Tax=Agrobacterium rosae TaxID=1972867 RepID=A0AAW9FHI6_9HYPH|nr:DNA polymerase [Agrobacterium rosae]MDX8305330.1 DNA polymerase [Agrobacterium rosae]
MTERVLVYLPDPYGVGNSKYAIADSKGIELVDGLRLSEIVHEAVTYDVMTLVDDLRRSGGTLPARLIDIGEAIRLSVGVSKSDGGEQKWNLWKRAKPHFNKVTDWKLAQSLHEGRALHPNAEELLSYLGMLANAITSLWSATKQELSSNCEIDRFFSVEVPVAQIFYNRQFKGVPIDTAKTGAAIQKASAAKYDAYREVADALKVSPTGLSYWNISRHLKNTDAPEIGETIEGYALRDQLKLAADISVFAKSFTEYQSASRDVAVLTRLSDGDGRVHPIFHPMGTISGRILVSDPHLQELRRSFRHSIAADYGCEVVYFDYSQFEPGIMASISEDQKLIALYNTGDVYSALSQEIFGSSEHRNLSKKVFLAFSYGMSAEGIAALVVGKNAHQAKRTEIEAAIKSFFSQFHLLAEFKLESEKRLAANGYVSSLLGNYRHRNKDGALTGKERRWSLSHTIQGTASLIFKRALLSITHEFGPDAVILPMHDAVVMQLPTASLVEMSERVKHLMEEAFVEYCPRLTVKVTAGKFDG